jgi:F-type H+-transporting ATPase subunit delta
MKAADRILSKRYARGYIDLDGRPLSKQGEAAAMARISELLAVRNAFSQFRRVLLHPLVGYDDKNEALSRLLPKELMLSQAAVFVRLLIKENRFYLMESIIEDCMRFYNAYAGIVSAMAVSRHLLGADDLQRVGNLLSAATGKKVRVSQMVSDAVIGGMEIRMGDLLIDATVKGRLERLKSSALAL